MAGIFEYFCSKMDVYDSIQNYLKRFPADAQFTIDDEGWIIRIKRDFKDEVSK